MKNVMKIVVVSVLFNATLFAELTEAELREADSVNWSEYMPSKEKLLQSAAAGSAVAAGYLAPHLSYGIMGGLYALSREISTNNYAFQPYLGLGLLSAAASRVQNGNWNALDIPMSVIGILALVDGLYPRREPTRDPSLGLTPYRP